jgi:hypothetical protein
MLQDLKSMGRKKKLPERYQNIKKVKLAQLKVEFKIQIKRLPKKKRRKRRSLRKTMATCANAKKTSLTTPCLMRE